SGRVMQGSILRTAEEDTARDYVVAYRDDDAWYVLVRTGLFAKDGDKGMADRLEIQKEHEIVSHGSYSFDTASIRIATGEDQVDGGVDGGSFFSSVAAERMSVKALGGRIPLIGGGYCPRTSYVLWKMPFGAVLLIREVNGKLVRLVSQRDQLR